MGVTSVDPQTLQKLFGQPQNPLYGTAAPPDPSQPTPAPAAPMPANNAPQPPSPTPSSGASLLYGATPAKPPMSQGDFAAANPDATKPYMPVRPIGDFDKIPEGQPGADTWGNRHNVLRHALASLFAGAAEFGGDINHHPGASEPFISRWQSQSDAQRQFDNPQFQEKAKAGALQQAYQAYLQQGGEQATIGKTQAETRNLNANVPLLQHQQQFLDKVRTLKESGKYQRDEDLFNAVLPEAATIPGLTRQMIVDQINNAQADRKSVV